MKRLYFLTVLLSICLYVNTFFATKEGNKCFLCLKYLFLSEEGFNKGDHVKKLKILKCCYKKVCDECYKIAKDGSGKCYNCKKNFDVESTLVQHNDGPRGKMTVSIEKYPTGHCEKENCIICDCESTILATFNMYEKGYHRGEVAYFPNNKYGLELLGIFKIAFDNNLLFQLGTSVTTGGYGIVFAGIHFKTQTLGGATNHAYPDHEYLKRIKMSACDFYIPCVEHNDIINNRKIGKCILQNYLDQTFTTLLPKDDNYKEGCVDRNKFEEDVVNTKLTEEEKEDDNYVKGCVDGKIFEQKDLKTELTEEEKKGDEYLKNSVCSWCASILWCC